jgi:hypothetical protein
MDNAEAIAICQEWFAYLDRQEQKTKRLQELAALARTGPEGHAEAKRELARIDRQAPTVYDGGRLLPAVKHLVKLTTPTSDMED